MEVSVQFCEAPSREVREAILAPLVRYNDSKVGVSELRPIAVEIRSADGQVTGGLWGGTIYGWLYIELLVVPEPLRGQGLGRKVMEMAEAVAVSRGCHAAWLSTFEFQARGFYERLGYSSFAELRDYPEGCRLFFMRKALVAEGKVRRSAVGTTT